MAGVAHQLLALAALVLGVLLEQQAQELRQTIGVGLGRGLREEGAEIRAQLLAGLVAVGGVGLQRPHHDAIQLGRHAVGDLRRRDRARVAHALERVGGRVALGWPGANAAGLTGNSCCPVSSSQSKMPHT